MMVILNYIKYKFHRLGFYFYSVKYSCQDKSMNLFKAIVCNLKIFSNRYGYYEYLEIPITTKCSLRCKNCSNIIPYYKCRGDYDKSILIRSIKIFLKCINNIVYIRILGGEPFLSDNLKSVILLLLKSRKVQRIEIVTNGTIVIRDRKLIKLLQNSKIVVCISKYSCVDSSKFIDVLVDNSINYRIDDMKYWMDYCKPIRRERSERELRRQFSKCRHICHSLVNGQVHLCPRSSHGTDLGIIKNNGEDYLDLLDNSMSVDEKRDKLNKLLSRKYIEACRYCIYGTRESRRIKVAEQMDDSFGR